MPAIELSRYQHADIMLDIEETYIENLNVSRFC
jgi:hypothetical protein